MSEFFRKPAFLKGGLGQVAVAFVETRTFGDPTALRRKALARARQQSWGRTRKEARERFQFMTGRDSADTMPQGGGYVAF